MGGKAEESSQVTGKKRNSCVHCSAFNCTNNYSNTKGLSFFTFPNPKTPDEAERCQRWRINSRSAHLDEFSLQELHKKQKRLCAEHFEDSQFMNSKEKKKLIWSAIPTIFNVPNKPAPVTPSRSDPQKRKQTLPGETPPSKRHKAKELETTVEDTTEDVKAALQDKSQESPTKRKMRRTIQKLRTRESRAKKKINGPKSKRQYKEEHIIAGLKEYLAEETVNFIRGQMVVCKRSKKGYRWNFKDKMLALSIYYQSKKAYSLLKQLFNLPSKSTIQRTLQQTNIYPGFNEKIFDALKVKTSSMVSEDKLCLLAFDEMSIKEFMQYNATHDSIEGFEDMGESGKSNLVANHALVFMVRGLYSKWKQPLGYVLTSGPIKAVKLHVLIQLCLEKLEGTGLNVKVLLSDQGTNNRSALEKLGISVSQPYFLFRGRKVFCMYDPPHLIKSIRNNLAQHGFVVNGNIISWSHVVKFVDDPLLTFC